ncbi:hypothetical protein SSX86_010267 [Deinandra increscens subsp. villosa]|uniref:Transferase n=1 Tax=Deinandra increscens subsp. villosa TaxID=3103831 RepID=A0AAP0H2D2_9ASTR
MKIEKQSPKLITPSNPTHPTLRRYKLGFTDEFIFGVEVGVVLFFPANNPNSAARLETSLKKTLTRFYPLAGRYVEEIQTVDCNDQGAEFRYATASIKLKDYLVSDVNFEFVDDFFPSKVGAAVSLLACQVTTFECGGVAFGVSISHRVGDASTLCTFINEWAVINREENNETEFTGPGFNSSVLFPARGLSPVPVQRMTDDMLRKYTRRKVVFSESVISNMKAKSTRQWSRTQVASAIIWKTFMFADLAMRGQRRESAHIQPVNLRERMGSLIPKDSCGNMVGLSVTECKSLETTIEELADRLTESVKRTISNFSKVRQDDEEGQEMVLNSLSNMINWPQSTNVVVTSSWCSFPFYEVDFGFGKPIWAAPWNIPGNDVTFFMGDGEGKGVNAYVCLQDKYVPYFEQALQQINAFVV